MERGNRTNEKGSATAVETSLFASIGAVDPALSAMTDAIRAGGPLIDRHGLEAAHVA
ncbi:MAG TPA: hypothetical protein VE127_12710 [Solirubrobacteraceae bacterium]|nr:hypothetical protein [Solirubrobacteraceae bacterium]